MCKAPGYTWWAIRFSNCLPARNPEQGLSHCTQQHSILLASPSLFQSKLTLGWDCFHLWMQDSYPFLLLMIPPIAAIQWLTADMLCIWRYTHNANVSLWPVLVGHLESRALSLGELQPPCLSSSCKMPNFPPEQPRLYCRGPAPQLNSPLHRAEQGRSRLVVEGDDETGGWQVSVIAYRSAPAAQDSTGVSQTLPSSS